ncbi:nose resistant to fluoxetine protein 6 [Parasteatoda tepidariorum]|uniref:nose resistant to fluoxetine protein 6 n=1 Tax=Parasteatoda tepidariorum TaxID=114398 RepID=UPI001C71E1F9|nr:nose resistant to fluoxetine protein 6 [Parasteatoda tepidariorum]
MRRPKASTVRLILIVGFLLFLTHKVSCELDNYDEINENNIYDQWKELDKKAAKLVNSAIRMILPKVMESSSSMNISSECVKQGMHLISGLRRLKIWAFSFIDSSSKMVDGILRGNINSPGIYEECLNIKVPSKNSEKPMFHGQYCQVNISPPLPPKSRRYKNDEPIEELKNFTGSEVMNLLVKKSGLLYNYPHELGFCVPSGCNTNDLSQIAELASKEVNLMVSVKSCEVKQKPHYSVGAILGIVLLCYMGLLVLSATACEWVLARNDIKNSNSWMRIFLCFSLTTNAKHLFSTKTSNQSLKCLHGIKFLSITLVVMVHSYMYPYFLLHAYQRLFDINEKMKEPMNYMIMNTHVVVDTFYCITGLLVCYITLKTIKMDYKKLNILHFIFYRLWRLAPVYYFVLLVTQPVSLMGSGPYFKDAMNFSVNNCANYWWRNVLFINNFFSYNEICMVHTWYVSIEFQLYLSTLLVLIPLMRSQKVGITINILIVVVSVIYTGTMTYIYDLPAGASLTNIDKDLLDEAYLKTYANPLSHAGAYFIGFLVGYILVVKPDVKIPQKFQILGWFVAVFFAWFTMFYNSIRLYYGEPSDLELAIYGGLYRNTWVLAVAWMTFCCCTGRGGYINAFLSWSPWVPLAKLTLLIYLIQPTLQLLFTGVFKSPHEYTHYELVIVYFGLLLMAGLLAVGCNLLIESPLLAIEKILQESFAGQTIVIVSDTYESNMNGFSKTDATTDLKDFKDIKYEYSMENKAFDEV